MGVDFSGLGRDVKCAGDVGRMVALGKYDVEFDAYGCTYWRDGKQYYRASSNGEAMFDFVAACNKVGIYPTPVEQYTYQTVVPIEMREHFMEQTKITLIQQLKQKYQGLFAVLQPLADIPPNNESLPLLWREAGQLEGHFDDMALQRFEGTMQFAYNGKVLDDRGLQQLQHWLARERKQMEDDPVVADRFERTFYGFAYCTETGVVKYFCDAQKLATQERWKKLAYAGKFMCPILKKTYWFDEVSKMSDIRVAFLQELKYWQDEEYIMYLQQLKELPGVISVAALAEARKELQENASVEAVAVMNYYGCIWNKK